LRSAKVSKRGASVFQNDGTCPVLRCTRKLHTFHEMGEHMRWHADGEGGAWSGSGAGTGRAAAGDGAAGGGCWFSGGSGFSENGLAVI
jgi:hypothetical protein